MGVDLIAGGRSKRSGRTVAKTTNDYKRMLVKLFGYMDRRIDGEFNGLIQNRLVKSRSNARPMSVSRVAHFMKGNEDKIAVLVGTVVDDERLLQVPKMTICALRFSQTARARIEAVGGECMTFDQLALKAPTGSNTVVLRGQLKNREAVRHFNGKPYDRKGNKHMKGRAQQ